MQEIIIMLKRDDNLILLNDKNIDFYLTDFDHTLTSHV